VEDVYTGLNASGVKVIRNEEEQQYSKKQILSVASTVMEVINELCLVLLLTIFIMLEKRGKTMFNDKVVLLKEIEHSIKNYISLKTVISFSTGVMVAIILLLLTVKLAVLFGLLSFVLNFIPNIGSMIAMFLPLPIVIVDSELQTWPKVGAFVGPGIVQGYVGNALEPSLFGQSLNMTPLAILAALVIWGSIWGIVGAILSVPLLAIMKICLSHANHPIAKYVLMLVREDPTVDELAGMWKEAEEDEIFAAKQDTKYAVQ
jgi:AI-2 transport protein TqsA